jgi:hypothetical protein
MDATARMNTRPRPVARDIDGRALYTNDLPTDPMRRRACNFAIDGVACAVTPTGALITIQDLPAPGADVRWVARRKLWLLTAIGAGLIGEREACRRYALSSEEIDLWRADVDRAGKAGLGQRSWLAARREQQAADKGPAR